MVRCLSEFRLAIATIFQYPFAQVVGKSSYKNENMSCPRKQKRIYSTDTLLKLANSFHHICYATFESVSKSIKRYYLIDLFMPNLFSLYFSPENQRSILLLRQSATLVTL